MLLAPATVCFLHMQGASGIENHLCNSNFSNTEEYALVQKFIMALFKKKKKKQEHHALELKAKDGKKPRLF